MDDICYQFLLLFVATNVLPEMVQSGKGLGRDETGIATSIKAKLKFTKGGIGYKVSDDLTDHWWDAYYNTSVQNITVTKSDNGGIAFKTGDKVATRKAVTAKSYSSFVSGGSLVGSKIMKGKKSKIPKQSQHKGSSILLDESAMSKIKKGSSIYNRSAAKLDRIQQHDLQGKLVRKKKVTFAPKMTSVRVFYKKLSILRDFGQLRAPVKMAASKLSCLKKLSAYGPGKKRRPSADSASLLNSLASPNGTPVNVKKRKKKKAALEYVVTLKKDKKKTKNNSVVLANKAVCVLENTDVECALENGNTAGVLENSDVDRVLEHSDVDRVLENSDVNLVLENGSSPSDSKRRKRKNKKKPAKAINGARTPVLTNGDSSTGKPVKSKKLKKLLRAFSTNAIANGDPCENLVTAAETLSVDSPLESDSTESRKTKRKNKKKRKLSLCLDTSDGLSPEVKRVKIDADETSCVTNGLVKLKKNRITLTEK